MQDTKLGQSKKDDPAKVAKRGFEALMEGKKKMLAGGLKSKVQALAATVMPDSAKAAMHGSWPSPAQARAEPAEESPAARLLGSRVSSATTTSRGTSVASVKRRPTT